MSSKLVQLEIGVSLAADLLGLKLSFLRETGLASKLEWFPTALTGSSGSGDGKAQFPMLEQCHHLTSYIPPCVLCPYKPHFVGT